MNIGTDFAELSEGPRPGHYSNDAGYVKALRAALRRFGISAYQLRRLLGMKYDWQIYRALGRSKPFYKLSSKYALRLSYLYELRAEGMALGLVEEINWDLGEVRLYGNVNADSGKIPKVVGRVTPTDQIVA